jgi:hypothetical protein
MTSSNRAKYLVGLRCGATKSPREKGQLMQLTSTHCRAQEVIQRDRAEAEQLDNVRLVAERAAAAWGREALAAGKREARHRRALTIAELAAAQVQKFQDDEDISLSENPDRGFTRL